jgi:hypothetical protein
MTNIQRIRDLVQKAQKLPNPTIEYNMELPKYTGVTPDSFYGIKAVYNPSVSKQDMAILTYKY